MRGGASLLAAGVTVLAVLVTDRIPWYAGPLLMALALLSWRDRHWIWGALGAGLVWAPAAAGPAGVLVLGAAIGLGAVRWRALSTVLVALGVALAVKQEIAASVLPAAADPIPWLLMTAVTLAGAVSAARGGAIEAGALGFAGLVVLFRLLTMPAVGLERLAAAERLGLVDEVYDGILAEEPELARALILAAPGRDAAAAILGWDEALNLGWRPDRADGAEVEVARKLEARGRGGEALRLLAKHPREGDVDALRALLERVQGEPVRWRGAPLGPILSGSFDPHVEFATNGYVAVEFTVREALPALTLTGEGSVWQGPPILRVRLDGGPEREWAVDGASTFRIDGPIEAGPHRIGLRFGNDLAGEGGDRNVKVFGVGAG